MTTDTVAREFKRNGLREDERVAGLRVRLQRLEGFLKEDPLNGALLTDVFEAALSCGEWERASTCLRTGQATWPNDLGWALREGDFLLAQGRLEEAKNALLDLSRLSPAPKSFAHVVAYNLAYIEFRQQSFAACIELLTAQMQDRDASSDEVLLRSSEVLWLRALHHNRELDRALAWVQEAEAQRPITPPARAVASLIALDAADLDKARSWSAATPEAAADLPIEWAVSRSSLALADRNAEDAIQFARQALAMNPEDGRAWSALAFGVMLGGDLEEADRCFSKALHFMPGHVGTWHGHAWTKMLRGDLGAALGCFEQALLIDRNFADSHGGLAVVLVRQGLVDEARQAVERALRLDPQSVSALYATALLSGQGDDSESVRRLARRLGISALR